MNNAVKLAQTSPLKPSDPQLQSNTVIQYFQGRLRLIFRLAGIKSHKHNISGEAVPPPSATL